MTLYLCSKSPRRIQLLTEHNIVYEVIENKLEIESFNEFLDPFDQIIKLAFMKAERSKRNFEGIILAADTGIIFNQKLIGKPNNSEHAVEILERLNGQSHLVVSACCLFNSLVNSVEFCVDYAKVTFKKVSKSDFENYVINYNPLDKAGAYGIQDGPNFIDKVDGDLNTVIGLPMNKLLKLFRHYGIVKSC